MEYIIEIFVIAQKECRRTSAVPMRAILRLFLFWLIIRCMTSLVYRFNCIINGLDKTVFFFEKKLSCFENGPQFHNYILLLIKSFSHKNYCTQSNCLTSIFSILGFNYHLNGLLLCIFYIP